MKKKLLLLSLVFHSFIATAFEGKAEVNGINYYIITKGAVAEVISKSSGYNGDIVIPSTIEYDGVTCSVTSIGNSAFYYETGLTSIVIPNSVIKIGIGAFLNCSKLKSVNIPETVASIGDQAFFKCVGLETVKTDNIESWCKMEIGNDANPLPYAQHFIVGNEEVENLVLPSTVTSICSRAFHGYKGLKTISISENTTSIGDYAFFQCTGLTTAILPNSITSIGVDAFYGCSALTDLSLSSGLTTISHSCFEGCVSLTTLDIPSSITSIEIYAFSGCKNLKTINFGSGLKTLGLKAFAGCSELTDVYCWSDNPPRVEGYYNPYTMPFYGSHVEYATLHVPEASISDYQSNSVWKNFGHIVSLTEGTGVSTIELNRKDTETYYSLDGRPANSQSRGLIIIRTNNGTTRKVIK